MILCSCTGLNTTRLEKALTRACAEDPWQIVTPGQAFRLTNLRFSCGRCAPLVADDIARILAMLQAEADTTTEAGPRSPTSHPTSPTTSQKGPSHEG